MIILGFLLLIIGADLLVKGSSNIAKKFHIPEILIGLTIVALGTSMPELMVAISSAEQGVTDLILGNTIGSNLCNLLLILGIIAIIRPVHIDKETRFIHFPVALLSTIIILIMGLKGQENIISRKYGIILVILYMLYFLYPIVIEFKKIRDSVREEKIKNKNVSNINTKNILLSIFFIILGGISLKLGGDLVVNAATETAKLYGISERVIGLTIVAIGTTLPELVTSIVALIKQEDNLAVGNLIGSCIFNFLLIVGTGAIITPIIFSSEFISNLILLVFSTLLIWAFCFIGKKNMISRGEATILLAIFLGYIINLFK